MQPEANEIILQYTKLTGREARLGIYEHSVYDFLRAGFTPEDFVIVVTFLIRENKRNSYKYSLKLGHLINDLQRFMDLLGEARALQRNLKKPMTPRQEIQQAFSPVIGERTVTMTAHKIGDFIKTPTTP